MARRSDRTDFLFRFSIVVWARDGRSEELVGEERFVGLQLTQPIFFQGELQLQVQYNINTQTVGGAD
jgi:hypothetical protein